MFGFSESLPPVEFKTTMKNVLCCFNFTLDTALPCQVSWKYWKYSKVLSCVCVPAVASPCLCSVLCRSSLWLQAPPWLAAPPWCKSIKLCRSHCSRSPSRDGRWRGRPDSVALMLGLRWTPFNTDTTPWCSPHMSTLSLHYLADVTHPISCFL